VLPVPDVVAELAVAHKVVVTLEDNGVAGGVGSAVAASLRRNEIDVPCRDVGLPQQFFDHASRGEVLADAGLTDQDVARRITGWVAALSRDDAGRDGLGRSGTIDLSRDDAGRDGVETGSEITEHLD
jgi:1-deoxy-D-xylulose-5-phosphate synthase